MSTGSSSRAPPRQPGTDGNSLHRTLSDRDGSHVMTSRGLEILSTDECLDLLRSQTLGRVAVQIGATPAISPVNYALLDDDVVFRTDPGTKLSAALMRTMVAYEVDDTDPATH